MSTYKMSLFDAILMNMNIMIGGGIFVGPAAMAIAAGNASFLAWPVTALIFLPLVLSVAQVMRLYPLGGGMFRYTESGLGRFWGTICAWIYASGYMFVGSVMLMCLYNTIQSSYGTFFLTQSKPVFYIIISLIIFMITAQSLKLVSLIQSSCTIIKLIPLLALIFLFPFQFNYSFAITFSEISHLPSAVVPWALFGFLGFEACCSVTHLIRDSEKNGPRSLLIGFFGVVGIYTLFHLAALHVMGLTNLIQYTASAFARFAIAPAPIVSGLDFLILASMTITFFASLLGIIFGNVSFLHTLIDQDVMRNTNVLKPLSSNGRPVRLLFLQTALIALMTILIDNITVIANSANICLFTGFTCMLFSLLKQNRALSRSNDILLNYIALSVTISMIGYSIATSESLHALIPATLFIIAGFLLAKK